MTTKRRARLNLIPLEARVVASASTNLFDSGFYLATYADVREAVQRGQFPSAEDHFRLFGEAEGRIGNGLFDARSYLAENPDVKAEVEAHHTTAFSHFVHFGQFEGREANSFFRTQDYLDDNPDVKAAVQNHQTTAFRHFLEFGRMEGRDPHRGFHTSEYLDDNPDVKAAVRAGQTTAYDHFLHYGEYENRKPSHDYSSFIYLDDNPDVKDAVARGQIGEVEHFTQFGFHEHRRFSATPITINTAQPTEVTGTSNNNSDKKFYTFTAPVNGTLSVTVLTNNGVFAKAEIEDLTGNTLFETNPNNGINSGSLSVTAGTRYLLRVRAPGSVAAQFTVRLQLS